MNKYLVINPFSLSEKVIVTNGDVVYAELKFKMYHIYCPKTKKYLGKISQEVFLRDAVEVPKSI
jgi:hypothetical protein